MIGKRLACFLVVLWCELSTIGLSQNYIIITSQMQGTLTACLGSVEYEVKIQNPSPYNLSQVKLTLTTPTGVIYQPASATNGVIDFNLTNPQVVVLTLPDIPSLTQEFKFRVKLSSACLSNYNGMRNELSISFFGDNGTGGLINAVQQHSGNQYNVNYPDLSLINMTNQSFFGNIGDVFQRCITITNGGNGPLSTFTLLHEHGTGLEVQANSLGTAQLIANGTNYTFSANDFLTVGNQNGVLDPGESITICETILIRSCSNAQSGYVYSWGCGGQVCQSMTDAANIVFDSETPNLIITRQAAFNNGANGLGTNCYGNNANGDFPSSVRITNTGQGDAKDVMIHIGQGGNEILTLINTNYYSSLNISSFTIEINGGGQQPLVPATTTAGAAKPCLPANPKAAAKFIIPLIRPNDVVVIRWNHYTCCADYCEYDTRRYLLHWQLEGEYKNNCGDVFPIVRTGNLPGNHGSIYYRNTQVLDNSPGTMLGSGTASVSFLSLNAEFAIPRNASHEFIYQLILPDNCLQVDLNSFIVRDYLRNPVGSPTSIVNMGDTIEFHYNSLAVGTQSTVNFNVSLDCSTCQTEGVKNIVLKTLYQPSAGCACRSVLGCTSAAIEVICPPLCEGLNLVTSKVNRINLGLPDNDNNGIPDAPGTIHDPTNMRTDRVMCGDTVEVLNKALVQNSNQLTFTNLVVNVKMTNAGQRMTYQHASVEIFKRSLNVRYNCNNVTVVPSINTTGAVRSWVFNVPLTALSCLPPGFVFETGDSVIVRTFFANTSNLGGGPITNIPVVNSLYLTEVPYTPTLPPNAKFGCNELTKEFYLIGYYWTNYGPNVYDRNNCGEFTISQAYYMSIGPCCNNYAGGNLFPFEYRYWGAPRLLDVILPDDYEFVSAAFDFVRTSGTLAASGIPMINLTPTTVVGNHYSFDVQHFFGPQNSGAQILYSDDGFYGTLNMNIRPTCNVADSTGNVSYRWFFDQIAQLSASGEPAQSFSVTDPITYQAPKLTVQSNQLSVNSQNGLETWDLLIYNASNISSAHNFWIGAPTINSIVADSLFDYTQNTMYYPNANGIFGLTAVGPAQSRNYRLYTTASSCLTDSIRVFAGWSCNGIPNSVPEYACKPLELLLKVNPLLPTLENSFTQLSASSVQLCDTMEFELKVRNYQLGYAFDITSAIEFPSGTGFVPGSGQLVYEGITYPIQDPSLVGGNLYNWDFTSSIVNVNGLVGITDETKNYFKVKFKLIPLCGFSSGSRIVSSTRGKAYCGSIHTSEMAYSDPIVLDDIAAPYNTDIQLQMDFITPCGIDNELTVKIVNQGPGAFANADSLTLYLPYGISFQPGSFIAIHNAGINTIPQSRIVGGFQQLTWPLLNGIAALDSMVFSIQLNTIPGDLPCEIVEMRASTSALLSATCSIDNSICDVGVVTGEIFKNIYVYKTDFSIANAGGSTVLTAAGSELISGHFDLMNQGATLGVNTPLIIKVYNDADMNGIYSAGDVLIHTDSLSTIINAGQTYVYAFNNVNALDACRLVAIISLQNNPCICTSKEVLIPLTYTTTPTYYNICANDTVQIGNAGVTPYTYLWEANGGIQNTNIAQPYFATDNMTALVEHYTLVRRISRANCPVRDTAYVNVYPRPLADISGTIIVCQDAAEPVITFTGTNGVAPYVFSYTLNGGTVQTITSTGNIATIASTTNVPGTFEYVLLSVQDASPAGCSNAQPDTAVVVVNPLPLAVLSGATDVCENGTEPVITFVGSNGTAPYIFSYTLNGGVVQTVTSTGDTAVVNAPTNIAGILEYVLVSVQDASSTACNNIQVDTVTILVNPLPMASISGTIAVCENDTEPVITFVGFNGTAPYIFSYTLNGGAIQTTTSTGNIATVNAPTDNEGTFDYVLVSVQDASSTTCHNIQTDTVTVLVNPLPLAIVSGTVDVCEDDALPVITFVGSNGTAPYIFGYTLNGGALQTVTSTGDTAVVNAPTDIAGTFDYVLVSVQDGSSTTCSNAQTGTVTILVNPLSLAAISGTVDVCEGDVAPVITFTGSNGTAPYTFTYNIDGGANQTIISTGNTASVNVPTGTAGTFVYNLLSIRDASSTTCLNSQVGAATVIVNPLPTAVISGTVDVCQNSIAPVLTFTGAGGTAPYTFTYNINGGVSQIVISTGNTAVINASTATAGTFVYNLLSVQDASSTTCANVQTGNATVLINPLPLAVISGTMEVCQNGTAPVVTFTGSNGTAPYIFTYTLNGGAPQTVISSGDIAVLNVSTAAPGTFIYELLNVQDAGSTTCNNAQAGSVTIQVNTLPTAIISGTASICLNSPEAIYISFNGSNGIAPYTFFYTINGGSEQSVVTTNGNSVTVVVPVNQVGIYTYDLVRVMDGSNTQCVQQVQGQAIVNVIQLPEAIISGGDSICQFDAFPLVTFEGSQGIPAYTFTYTINNAAVQQLSSGANTSVSVPVSTNIPGTFIYTLKGVGESGYQCKQEQTGSVIFVVHPKPIADFTASPGEVSISNTVVHFSNESAGAASYIWQFGDGISGTAVSPSHNYMVEGVEFYQITLVAVTEFGCLDTAYHSIQVREEALVFVPNTFTPDGNEHNNIFFPVIAQGVDLYDYSMSIFNRWGEMIFITKDVLTGWDGTYKGELCQNGTYIWKLEFKARNSEERFLKTGHVNLLR